jgi:type IV pilus assembly protein PilA
VRNLSLVIATNTRRACHGNNERGTNMYGTSTTSRVGRKDDKGFTLIEILIAIVLIGILSAVAVVGISNLVSKGSSASCSATRDASMAASAVYFASHSGDAVPNAVSFTQLTTVVGNGAPLTVPNGVTAAATTLTGSGWVITMTPGTATAAPSFSVCP